MRSCATSGSPTTPSSRVAGPEQAGAEHARQENRIADHVAPPQAARLLRDVKIHPSQKASASPGGGVRLSLAVEDPLSLASYVLGDAALVAPTLLLQLLVLQPVALALLAEHGDATGHHAL